MDGMDGLILKIHSSESFWFKVTISWMLFASDDEDQPCAHAQGSKVSRAKLDLLNKPCTCKQRTCYQQFLSNIQAVEAKREEIRNLTVEEKDTFLTELFNASLQRRRSHQFAIEDAVPDVPDFEATDSDLQVSQQEESDVLIESGASSQFIASDEDVAPGRVKRQYSERRKGQLHFLGKPVGVRSCARLLGVGQTTLQKIREGHAIYTNSVRPKVPRHPAFGFSMRGDSAEKWPRVIMFLWYVYHSAAEHMPTGFRHGLRKPESISEAPFTEGRDSDDISRQVNSFVDRLQKYSADIDIHMIGPGTFKGERRFLQHSSRTELFFEYLAFCDASGNQDPASYSCFLRVANTVVGPHLRSGHLHFRKENEHAKCDTCTRLKKNLKFKAGRAEAAREKEVAIKAYSTHILSQWLDRQIYWSFRSLSHSWCQQQRKLGER